MQLIKIKSCYFHISFEIYPRPNCIKLGLVFELFSSKRNGVLKKLRCPNNSDALVFVTAWKECFKSVLKFNEATHIEVFFDGSPLFLKGKLFLHQKISWFSIIHSAISKQQSAISVSFSFFKPKCSIELSIIF